MSLLSEMKNMLLEKKMVKNRILWWLAVSFMTDREEHRITTDDRIGGVVGILLVTGSFV